MSLMMPSDFHNRKKPTAMRAGDFRPRERAIRSFSFSGETTYDVGSGHARRFITLRPGARQQYRFQAEYRQ